LFSSLRSASWRRSVNKKALLLSQQGFFFVAEGGQISNLRLIEDIIKIVGFIESEVSGIQIINLLDEIKLGIE